MFHLNIFQRFLLMSLLDISIFFLSYAIFHLVAMSFFYNFLHVCEKWYRNVIQSVIINKYEI
jgi:hypothetical protein